MGLMDEAEKIAGAVAAVEGMKKLDPDASVLTEAAAAFTGFKGAGALAEKLKEHEGEENK